MVQRRDLFTSIYPLFTYCAKHCREVSQNSFKPIIGWLRVSFVIILFYSLYYFDIKLLQQFTSLLGNISLSLFLLSSLRLAIIFN